MISLRDVFTAIQSAYLETADLPNWNKVYAVDDKTEDLGIVCYLHQSLPEAFIVFRGTVPTKLGNLKSDLSLALSQVPTAFEVACKFDAQIRKEVIPSGYRVTYLGHSLGAAHDSLMACRHQGRAIVYDNPGIGALVKTDVTLSLGAKSAQTKIINFFSAPNIINTLHPQVGACYRIYIGLRGGMSPSHVIKSVAGAVADASGIAKDKLAPAVVAVAVSNILGSNTAAVAHALIKVADHGMATLRQHSVDNAVNELDSVHHKYLRLGRIKSWPRLSMDLFRELNQRREGLHTLSAEAELNLLEEKLKDLKGYDVDALELEAALKEQEDLMSHFFAAGVASVEPVSVVPFKFENLPNSIEAITDNALAKMVSDEREASAVKAKPLIEKGVTMAAGNRDKNLSAVKLVPGVEYVGAAAADAVGGPVTSAAAGAGSAVPVPIVSPADAASNPLLLTAKKGLGWSFSEANQRLVSQVFDLKDEQITLGSGSFSWQLYQVSDLRQVEEKFSHHFGFAADTGMNFVGGLGADYKDASKEAAKTSKNYVVIHAVYTTPCHLNQLNSGLSFRAGANLESLADTYVASGQIIRGYTLMFEGSLASSESSSSNNMKAELKALGDKVKLEAQRTHEKTGKARGERLGITIKAFGGFNIPSNIVLGEETFGEDYGKLNDFFSSNISTTPGVFHFTKADLQKYAVNSRLKKQYEELLEMLQDIEARLNNAINLHPSTFSSFLNNMNIIRAKIAAQISAMALPDFKEDIKRIVEEIGTVIKFIFTNNVIECESSIKFKDASNPYYLCSKDNRVVYSGLGSSFKIERIPGGSYFYLKDEDGQYLSLQLEDTFSHLVVCEKQESASKCELINCGSHAAWGLTYYQLKIGDQEAPQLSLTDGTALQFSPWTDAAKSYFYVEPSDFMLVLKSYLRSLNHIVAIEDVDIPILPSAIVSQRSVLADTQLRLARNFIANTFPKLHAAQGRSLIYFVGMTGSGKSLFTNYMLGHRFRNLKVVDMNKPHAKISQKGESETLYPTVYEDRSSGFSFCDTPGYADTRGTQLDALNQFSMFLTKEMAAEVKALVIIIPWDDIKPGAAGRGENLKRLLAKLETIIQNDLLKDASQSNIIFLINTMGNASISKNDILTRIEDLKKESQDAIRKLYKKHLPNEEGEDPSSWPAPLSRFLDFLSEMKLRLKALTKRSDAPVSSAPPIAEEIKDMQDIEHYEKVLRILEMIQDHNTQVWINVDSPGCRLALLDRLANIPQPIPKYYLRFLADEAFCNMLNLWVQHDFVNFLLSIENREDGLFQKISMLRILLEKDTEKRTKDLEKATREAVIKISQLQRFCERLNEEFEFEKIRLQGANSHYFLPWTWSPSTSVKNPALNIPITRGMYYRENMQLKIKCIEKVRLGELIPAPTIADNSVDPSLDLNLSVDEQQNIAAYIRGLSTDAFSERVNSIKKAELPKKNLKKKYASPTGKYQSTEVFGAIEDGAEVGSIYCLRADHPIFKGQFEGALHQIQMYINQIKECEDGLTAIRSKKDDEIVSKEKRLKQLESLLDEMKKDIENRQAYFLSLYVHLKRLEGIIDYARISNPTLQIPIQNLQVFVKICERIYPEATSKQAAMLIDTRIENERMRVQESKLQEGEIDIPNDGNSLYYSVAFSLLVPALKQEDDEFGSLCRKLFGSCTDDEEKRFKEALLQFNGRCASMESDELYSRINTKFRQIVVGHMKNKIKNYVVQALELGKIPRGLKPEDNIAFFKSYLKEQEQVGTWAGQFEIRAMEELLNIAINIDVLGSLGDLPIRIRSSAHSEEGTISIRLILSGQESLENHYRVIIDPRYFPVAKSDHKNVSNAATIRHPIVSANEPVGIFAEATTMGDADVSVGGPSIKADVHKPTVDQIADLLLERLSSNFADPVLQEVKNRSREEFATSALALGLAAQATHYGLSVRGVPGDGNCFFHAVADQLSQRGLGTLTHVELRMQAASYIVEHWDEFEPFIRALTLHPERYCNSIFLDGEWADDPIISALARAMRMSFIIVRSDGARLNVIDGGPDAPKLYLGYYVGLHYDSMGGSPNASMVSAMSAAFSADITNALAGAGVVATPFAVVGAGAGAGTAAVAAYE